ncbi:hypothetical protein DSM106972_018530 [Dulcicalothrix desertica PCC 7102]|uniref:BAH domain-containing protein n=1 Tax=Dulcicalothrix desertica PCC 7102 TaxID=232991 RepID=A0A433VN81_9CYAN|nr:glycosyltransferase [Dulcicalothrix desertica]RUT07593.1 hypothetical protein DSM106972_018530 [Dulcicalothrix desertica PCC 7102]TWH39762.1 glycosyltransferase involved in cell wall biosynthesis [Dulcicalothrix desertica PCC 7102]
MTIIAIVTPWFGKDLKGGAEQHGWQVATRLASRGHQVEVLTTCSGAFSQDWSVNSLKAAVTKEQGVTIRRFRVDSRDKNTFDQVNGLMLNLASPLQPGVNPVSLEESSIFVTENINSTELLNFLKDQHKNYHAFIFLPYLYGVILNGLPIVANKAFLQPCLHDEVYAYLPQVANIFHIAKALLFISEGEARLATKLYGPGIINKSTVVGAGIEPGEYNNQEITIKNFQPKQERFILCLGRRDPTKNTDLLIRAFASFKQQYQSNLKLVLAGPGSTSFNGFAPDLIDLGLVEEHEKEALLANCFALFQPSQNESYSRVMMEAWFYKRPVAVHGDCLATSMAVTSACGGWIARAESEWTELFSHIDTNSEQEMIDLGTKGYIYAQENAVWDKIIQRYEHKLGVSLQPAVATTKPKARKLQEIHQLLPNLAYGDAISNQAIAIRDYLRNCGYKSDIFVRYLDERVKDEAIVFNPKSINRKAGLIYHHSIGSELTDFAIAHPSHKCLIYHNITPAKFFVPYRPEFANILEKGRTDLKQLAQYFPVSVGDSEYNAAELAASGFSQPGVLPIMVNPSKWDILADAELMQKLQDGKANLLFVGRLAPNKRQDDLLEAFAHYLTMDCDARIILVGYGDVSDPYYQHLINTINRLNLGDFVLLPGQANDAELLAYYRTAHLFWSMSEHEGFCVPIVEAMWFDIPILAYKSTAVPETLGEAAFMFTSKDDLPQIAALAKLTVRDQKLRAKIIKAQCRIRNRFLPQNIYNILDNLISQIELDYHE